jgi:hypothetical protein
LGGLEWPGFSDSSSSSSSGSAAWIMTLHLFERWCHITAAAV